MRRANDVPRVSLEGSGPGGIRSVWDQVTKREEGVIIYLVLRSMVQFAGLSPGGIT